jgi:hypothetical protein
MITEKRLEEALKYLSDTDENYAKYSSGLEYLKDLSKRDKAMHIINNQEDNTISLKEHRYYASQQYQKTHYRKTSISRTSFYYRKQTC